MQTNEAKDPTLENRTAAEDGSSSTKAKSQLSRAFEEDGELKTHVGGQALLEGIMMRGKFNWAVAVREPDGNIHVEEHDLASGRKKNSWLTWPFIRGCTALVESLALSFKALEIAAEHAFDDELDVDDSKNERLLKNEIEEEALIADFESQFDEPVKENPSKNAKKDSAKDSTTKEDSGGAWMTFSMVIGIILGIVIFLVLPAFVTNLIVGEYDGNPILWNVVDGVIRVAIFIGYIWLIGRLEDMKRMFMFHGAEHKTIHCYEHGLPLTPENAMSFPRLHVRCGTAFLIMVMVIAIVVYTVIPVNAIIDSFGIPDGLPKLALVIAVRIVFLPLIAGISYEITVKWAGSHPDNWFVKVILWPGMQMQYLTTREPDADQIACAIAAMEKVLAREEAESSKTDKLDVQNGSVSAA